MENDFDRIIQDILSHDDIRMLDSINHHGSSILDHSMKVARLAWKWGNRLHLDSRSLARGALLHDFFLYDWNRESLHPHKRFYEIHKMHGFTHPVTALNNAKERFHLNRIERDIIKRHMFPLTLIPPRYPESWLVMIIDKIVAVSELPMYLRSLRK